MQTSICCDQQELELSPQCVDEARNITNKLIEQWDGRLKLGETDLCKRYREKRLGIHLHFRCKFFGQPQLGQFCAIFRHSEVGEVDERNRASNEVDIPMTHADGAGGNDSMLIGIVKLAEFRQGMFIWGAGLKGLRLLNDCIGTRRDAFYHGGRAGFVFVRFLENGELPVSFGCLVRQNKDGMVKGGAELIYNFTSNQQELDRWLSESSIDNKQTQLSRAYVWLQPHGISITLEPKNSRLEFLDVLHGPFNLCFDSV